MTIYTEASLRPRPAASSALEAGLARLTDARQREQVQRLAGRADFRIAEMSLHDTDFGLEVQLSGEGRLLSELIG